MAGATARGVHRAHGSAAVEHLAAPVTAEGEGARILVIGDSRTGKSYAVRAVLGELATRGLAQIIVAHDDVKRDPQYAGRVFGTVADFDAALAAGRITAAEARAIVFRGELGRHGAPPVEVDEVARLALRAARGGVRSVALVINELDRCMTPGGRMLLSPALRYAIAQGGGLGVTVIGETQMPVRAPDELTTQATAMMIFHLEPLSLAYLASGSPPRLLLEPEHARLIPRLERRDFTLWRRGERWDRTVYRF